MTSKADVVDPDYFGSFLHHVYGVWEPGLVECYTSVCDGILGFQRVNNTHRKDRHDKPLIAPRLPRALWDTCFESLITVDVSL